MTRRLRSAGYMRALGMLQFLEFGQVFSEDDRDLTWLKNVAMQSSKHIKRVLGIDVVKRKEITSGIKILNRLLNLLSLKLQQVNDVYQIDLETLQDGREKIFAVWQKRDDLRLRNLQSVNTEILDNSLNFQSMELQLM